MNACDKCEDIGTVHIFQGFGAMMDCVAFNSCHGNTQSGYCGTYHWGCGAGGETQAAEIAAVAASDDPAFIEDYLKEHKASAYYNPDRSVIQRIDCGGSITAQFPVSAAVAAALN